MSNSWEQKTLSEAIELQRGFDLPALKRQSGQVPVVASTSIVGYHNVAKVHGPGVVIGRSGSIGGAQWIDGDFWPLNTTLWVKNFRGNDPLFTYHLLASLDFSAFNVGTGVPTLNRNHLSAIQVTLPPLDEQRRIAGVLGALDDLIEVNRGLIRSLLKTVDAEFSRMFERRDLTLTLGSFTKVVDCLHSKKPERVESSHRLLQLSNIDDSGQLNTDDFYGISRDDYVLWTKNLETRDWDCVITNVGRVGAVARIPSGVHAALGRNMTAIRPIDPESDGAFVIAGLRARPVRREIELRTDTGTVMDALNVKNIPGLRLPQASSNERAAFQSFAAPLLRAADDLRSENSLLASTRNELLPLLMSGRVRVGEAGVAA